MRRFYSCQPWTWSAAQAAVNKKGNVEVERYLLVGVNNSNCGLKLFSLYVWTSPMPGGSGNDGGVGVAQSRANLPKRDGNRDLLSM
jgi:hypothetical protein